MEENWHHNMSWLAAMCMCMFSIVRVNFSCEHSGFDCWKWINTCILYHWVNKGVSDCCLMPIQQFFTYIMARTMRWWWGLLCTRPTCLVTCTCTWLLIMTCCDVNSLPSSYIPIVLMFDYSENKTMHTQLSRAMKDGKKVNYYLLLLVSTLISKTGAHKKSVWQVEHCTNVSSFVEGLRQFQSSVYSCQYRWQGFFSYHWQCHMLLYHKQ
jgi:hypothetical protein